MERLLFTSESVTEGHPDKICDQISDAVLDALLEQDPMSRVACETAITTGLVLVMGEITTNAYVDIQKLVRETIDEIGYNRAKYGFDAHTCGVVTAIDEQSADIALGVDKALEAKENKMSDEEIEAIGAGDQGMMFGYASNETEEFMPYPIALAHKLALRLTKVRKDGTLPYLRPDGKTQVTVEYDENGVPARLDAVVLSTQHDPEVTQEQIHADVKKYIFDEILPAEMVDENTKFFINPTGRFVIGGPNGDSGVTGRKIIVDTYGGMARHGGGAFSGKDCTKVDRSAAYAARYVAKNIVAAGLADKCEIQLSYAIGVAQPTSIMIDTFGTGKKSNQELVDLCQEYAKESGATITLTEDVKEGTKDADVICTDVWVSMGEPDAVWRERIEDLMPYQVNRSVMQNAGNAIFMHCLPAYHDRNTGIGREIGERFGIYEMEVTDEVFESEASVVFDEAENRMHTIKAVMAATLGYEG